MQIAIIDLGTNSARLYIYKSAKRRPFQLLYRMKAPAKLGEGLFHSGFLDSAAVDRTINIFEEFSKVIKSHQVDEIKAVATSALREARDRRRVITVIQEKFAIDIKVISGKEEARLIAKGVVNTLKLPDPEYLLIDIGGGSTEISIVKDSKIVFSDSLQLGSARNQQMFLCHIPPIQRVYGKGLQAMRENVQEILTTQVPKNLVSKIPMAIGTSGAIRAYRAMLSDKSHSSQVFSLASFRSLLSEMKGMTREQLLHIPKLEAKRTDTILAAGVILDEVCRFFSCQSVYSSSVALKDGILAEFERQNRK